MFDFEFLCEELKEGMRIGDVKHGKFTGPRQAVGAIECELSELRAEVFTEDPQPGDDRKEALDVMITAAKYIRDCCDYKRRMKCLEEREWKERSLT